MGVRMLVQRPLVRVGRQLRHYLRDRSTIETQLIGDSVKNVLEKPKGLGRGREGQAQDQDCDNGGTNNSAHNYELETVLLWFLGLDSN